ncbi:MAG: kelch motif-containing protein [Acidimicrobiia bacterium]|nr:kelch motif-containing protein [Acidimicrobiia bacterium]
MTWTYDLRAGEWTIEDTVTPDLPVGAYLSPWGRAVYDETARRSVITADGVVAGYDAARHEWEILSSFSGGVTGPKQGCTTVYDPTSGRIIAIGGSAQILDNWVEMNDVWAFNTGTGTWSELLAQSTP